MASGVLLLIFGAIAGVASGIWYRSFKIDPHESRAFLQVRDNERRCGMKIEVFGPGCPKCQQLENVVRGAVSELGVPAEIEKVRDVIRMAEAGVMIPPAVSINGKIKCSGRVPKSDEIKKWILEVK